MAARGVALEAVGIAGIMPVDHAFILDADADIGAVVDHIRHMRLPLPDPPRGEFPYREWRRSGGGRVPNILAYLGASGHDVAILGTVGADLAGGYVVDDLKRVFQVDVGRVQVREGTYTRTVCILYRGSMSHSRQEHVTAPRTPKFGKTLLRDVPQARVLIVGRANRSILDYVKNLDASDGPRVCVHLNELPWRKDEAAMTMELLKQAHIVVARRSAMQALRGSHGLDDASGPIWPFSQGPGPRREVVVEYEGPNQLRAEGEGGRTLSAAVQRGIRVEDPTGDMDCFHGALLSFCLREGFNLADKAFAEAAISYANQMAAASATGIGARHFPQLDYQHVALSTHKAAYLRRKTPSVFISYAWDGASHRRRVSALAGRLTRAGIHVSVDVWDVDAGTHLRRFMDEGIEGSDWVLVICTPKYLERAERVGLASSGRLGHAIGSRTVVNTGVAYEMRAILERMDHQRWSKVVPVLFQGTWETAVPSPLRQFAGYDAGGPGKATHAYRELASVLARPKDAELPDLYLPWGPQHLSPIA